MSARQSELDRQPRRPARPRLTPRGETAVAVVCFVLIVACLAWALVVGQDRRADWCADRPHAACHVSSQP